MSGLVSVVCAAIQPAALSLAALPNIIRLADRLEADRISRDTVMSTPNLRWSSHLPSPRGIGARQ